MPLPDAVRGQQWESDVATLAAESLNSKEGAGAAPISTHPAFPAIVALWFAALLGLGSLILPVVLLERLASVTGLASLVPSAAPPLGFTARAVLALGAAIFGAGLGLLLARQVAAGQAPRPRERFSGETRQCRPISAHDELGDDAIGPPGPSSGGQKRRSLAIADEGGRSDFLDAAPLPGERFDTPSLSPTDDEEALELATFAEADEDDGAPANQDFSMTDANRFAPPARTLPDDGERELAAETEREARLPRAFEPLPESEPEDNYETEPVEALPFAAPSLRRAEPAATALAADDEQAGDEHENASEGVVAGAFDPARPQLSVVENEAATDATWEDEADDERALDRLGLVQLATRLGAAIERRRARRAAQMAAAPATTPVFAAAGEDFAAAPAEDAERARADYFGGPQANRQAAPPSEAEPVHDAEPTIFTAPRTRTLAEIDFGPEDEGEEPDLAASFSLPLRERAEEETRPAAEDEADEAFEAEDEYSSLLAMKNPFQQNDEFVRVEGPEPEQDGIEATVTFPARKADEVSAARRPFDPPERAASEPQKAPRDRSDAERELRAALETLQRMSGAA